MIDLKSRPISVRTVADPTDFGPIRWLKEDRFAYFGNKYSGDVTHIFLYDSRLRRVARVPGWTSGYEPALVRSNAYGVSFDGPLVAARLPFGRVRALRRLPGEAYVIASATG